MSSGLIVALEITVVLGGLLALAVWELVRLRRERLQRDRSQQAQADDGAP